MNLPEVSLRLPALVGELVGSEGTYPEAEDRMRLAVRLARENVERGTGGPFGAAVFEKETGRLVAPGVNLVVGSGLSLAHAEVVAVSTAQKAVGTFDLGGPGLPAHELVTSAEPCIMCLGATIWSGVRSLQCGARDDDARRVGFDEGPKPEGWEEELERRGIRVVRDVLREEADAVLRSYAETGGEVYNARRGDS
jgi:tRNA(Arg) A34 adenosine deaminase TadA